MSPRVLCSVVLLALGAATAQSIPGQVLVKAAPGQRASLETTLAALGTRGRAALPALAPGRDNSVGLDRILVVDVAPGSEDALLAALTGRPEVEWASRNGSAGGITGATIPNDPSFPSQWALHQASDIDMDLPEAWDLRGTTLASSMIVAVVDTGYDVNVTSADWTGTIWTNPAEVSNGADDDGNGLVDDLHGYDFAYNDPVPDAVHPHGVNTAGIIAAHTANAAQISGIADGVTILPVKAFDNFGFFPSSGPYAGHLSAVACIAYAVDHGAQVISNSWTNGTTPSTVINDAIDDAVANGVHLVFAAGNNGTSQGWPAQHADVTAVAAIDKFGKRSNWGFQSSTFGVWVDVCAAGTDVTTTTTGGGVDNFFAGTSAACPQVAGVAALLLSEDGDLQVAELRAILRQGAVSVDALNPGFAGLLGSGHVNALASLKLLSNFTDLGQGLAGDSAPLLNAWGDPTSATGRITLSLSQAPASSLGLLFAGFSAINAPFKGGMLVPAPDLVAPVMTTPLGKYGLLVQLTSALPAGPVAWLQFAYPDAGAPLGTALSNAVLVTGS